MSTQTIKCRYFNRGFCSQRSNCKYLHPTIDCECSISLCPHRHQHTCKNQGDCYYNSLGLCEFKHSQIQIKSKKIEENQKLKEEN